MIKKAPIKKIEELLFVLDKGGNVIHVNNTVFEKAFHSSPSLMAILSADGQTYLYVNDTFIKKLGYAEKEVISKKVKDLNIFHKDNSVDYIFKKFKKNKDFFNIIEVKLIDKKNQIHIGNLSIENITIAANKCWLVTMTDITDLKNNEARFLLNQKMLEGLALATKELLFNNNLLSALTNSINIIGKSIDIDRIFCFENNFDYKKNIISPTLITQWQSNYIIKNKLNQPSLPYHELTNFIKPLQKGKSIITLTKDIKSKQVKKIMLNQHINAIILIPIFDGTEFWGFIDCEECETEMPWTKDDISMLESFANSISGAINRKDYENKIEYLSYHDQLTGLYNRRYYEEEILRIDNKQNLPITLAIGDINRLKLVNDSFGHAIGDELIKKAAKIIKTACRADDVIARLGGDEFVILFPNTNKCDAKKVINRINVLASQEKIGNIDVSISFGYKTKTKETESISEIFDITENNMYRDKLYGSSSMKSRTIDQVLNTLFENYPMERAHSKRVGRLCADIAIEMNFDRSGVEKMKLVGNMHDIGKIGIDQKILNKNGKLTTLESEEIQRHSEIGYRILSSANEFSEVANYVLEHHEKWDGTGYPKGKTGFEISLQARIIALADAYDSMTSDRVYRAKMTKQEAINEIIKCSGTQFDPSVVKIFIENVLNKQ